MQIKLDTAKVEQAAKDIRALIDRVEKQKWMLACSAKITKRKAAGQRLRRLSSTEANNRYQDALIQLYEATPAYIEQAVSKIKTADETAAQALR